MKDIYTKKFQIKLTDQEHELLKKKSSQLGITISNYLRLTSISLLKNDIVNQSIDIAIGNLYKKLVQLQSLKNEFSLGFEMEFIQMSEKEQIECLCNYKNLKEIQELKIQLIKLELFEELGDGCKAFLSDLHKNKLKLLRNIRRFY